MTFLKQMAIRLGYALALLLAVVVLNFTLIHIAPGDIADTIAGDMGGATEEVMAQIRADYGLDKPFLVQLGIYLGNVVRLDFGYSFFFNTPVTSLIAERLPATLLLVFTAQILALVIGVVLGVISARRPDGLLSHFVTLLALFGYSAPVFWTGIMLLIGLSLMLPLFPVAGMIDVTLIDAPLWRQYLSVAHHLFLPALTLASIFLALYSRLCRASMLEVLGADYIRTARAKGLSEHDTVYRHALKNSLGSVVTLARLLFSSVVSGAVPV